MQKVAARLTEELVTDTVYCDQIFRFSWHALNFPAQSCDMCKIKLMEDPKSRVDVDPVSGKEVDKAKAVIGAASDGAIYFFENADNLRNFRTGSAGKVNN